MIFIILTISIILGITSYFISNFIMIEDLTKEKVQKQIKIKEYISLTKNKIKKEKKNIIIVILITAIIYISLYIKFRISFEFYKFIFLFTILIISSIIDIEIRVVYFITSIIGIVGGLAFFTVEIIDGANIITRVISILIPMLILGILKITSSKYNGLGGGDIEVFIFTALYLSILDIGLSLVLSLIIGGIGATISLIKNKDKKIEKIDKYIPFVPYITIATYITVIFGNQIIIGYLNIV